MHAKPSGMPFVISSAYDLHDANARKIALLYELKMSEILPGYLSLCADLKANDGQIRIDTGNPETPLNAHNGYRIKLACGAVVVHELACRRTFRLPVEGTTESAGVTRDVPARAYRRQGLEYERLIASLDEHQREILEEA